MPKPKNKVTPTHTFHVYLTVDIKFAKLVSRTSRKIFEEFKSEFVVGENYVPHFTLYLFSAPVRNTKKIVDSVGTLGSEIKALRLTVSKLNLSYDGWLMVGVNEKDALLKYHTRALTLLNNYREDFLRQKYRKKSVFDSVPPEEKEILLKYGDRNAGSRFNPHVSVAEIANQNEATSAFEKYKTLFNGKDVYIKSLELVIEGERETGANGKVIFRKVLDEK